MKTEGYNVELCGTEWFISETYPVDEEKSDGITEFDDQTILINSELHSHRKALAVVHEMLHVVCESVGLDEDEELIRKLEHGVYNMINVFPEEYKKQNEDITEILKYLGA